VPVLDSLRAIAALSVCLFHFVCGPVNFITDKDTLHFFSFGAYGVQLFFVISGFIIPWSVYHNAYKIKHYGKFLLKRFLRLEPPYVFSMLLVIALYFLRRFYTDVPDSRMFSFNQILLHFGYLIPFFHESYKWLNDAYWTLAIEFQFYLFMGLFYFVIVHKKAVFRVLSYAFALSLSFIGTHKFLLYWLPVFLLGNMLFLYLSGIIKKPEFYIVSSLVMIFIGVFYSPPVFFSSLIPTLAILYLYNFSNPLLDWLGKISYSIYLTHSIVGSATINVMLRFAHSPLMKVGIILAGIAVTITFSYMVYLFIEKPSKKLSSKIRF
jgi:peptidoglycan/LPS O-acetylase OafA/YrhL